MMNAESQVVTLSQSERLASTGVRRLTPSNTRIFEGSFSLLHCAVTNDNTYRGVFAVLMFPIRHPDRFISLRHTDLDDKEEEIGVIEDLSIFPKDAQEMISENLARHYHEKIITGVRQIEHKHGLLFFKVDVEPEDSEHEFIMYWSYNSAEEYGETGKVLIDVYENRLIIRDLSALSAADRRTFESFIYW